jgi:hypothetical protein
LTRIRAGVEAGSLTSSDTGCRAHQTDPSPRILLVEDDEAIRFTLTQGLYELSLDGADVLATGNQ